MYQSSDWSVVLRAVMDISARASSLAERPRSGQMGHQCSHAPGRPNLHLVSSSRRPRRVSATSSLKLARLEGATTSKHAPGDTRQLVGKCDSKDVAMQSLLRCIQPGLEPMTIPALRFDQHHPRGLHEQNT